MPKRRICALNQAVNTHTLDIVWEGRPRPIRLLDVNPESAFENSGRPPTDFGRSIYTWLCDEVLRDVRDVEVETPSTDMVSNSGKLLGHVFVRGENLAVRIVRQGLSPCFEKYGYPTEYGTELSDAERWAMREGLGVWGGPAAERYRTMKRWWLLRAGQVERCRHAMSMGEDILDARRDYGDIVKRASVKADAVVFADATNLFMLADGASLLQLASPCRPLCAYLPATLHSFARYLAREHVGECKPNYLWFTGSLTLEGDQPQLTVDMPDQLRLTPPHTHP